MDSKVARVSGREELGLVDDLNGEFSSRSDDEGSTGRVSVVGGIPGFGEVAKTGFESWSEEGEGFTGSGSGLVS